MNMCMSICHDKTTCFKISCCNMQIIEKRENFRRNALIMRPVGQMNFDFVKGWYPVG